jgi:hypothetical protein
LLKHLIVSSTAIKTTMNLLIISNLSAFVDILTILQRKTMTKQKFKHG